MSIFRIFLVCIFLHSDWILRDTDQKNKKIRTRKTSNTDTFHAVGWTFRENLSYKAYFIKWIWTLNRTQTFRKYRPWIFRKWGFYDKIKCIGWKFITDKFKGVDFKYDNNFFKLQSKARPNTTFLVPNFIFIFLKFPFLFLHI